MNDHDRAVGVQPGRAAYEAFMTANGLTVDPLDEYWGASESVAWEAAAQAAIAAAGGRDHYHQAVISEREDLRDLVREILGAFDPSKGDGYRARVGQVQVARWRDRAGLEAER